MTPPATKFSDVQVLNPLTLADWDERLRRLPGAGFFHSQAWARVLHGTYGYDPVYLVQAAPDGSWLGLLPLMGIQSWLTGRRGISLPFTDEVEPLVPDAATFDALFRAGQSLAERSHWKYLECRGGRSWRPEAPASTSFLHHTLDLTIGEPALLAGCDDAVRRAIRKAEKSQVEVTFSRDAGAVHDFYRLLELTRRRHGVPPQPYAFFEQIQRQVMAGGHGQVVLARHQGRPVAGAVYFQFQGRVIYKFGASDETQQQLRANNLVMWRAIQHFTREGQVELDFGRTSLGNTGLRQFKRSWGTQEETLSYLRYDCRQHTFVTAPDEAEGWHNRIFRAMPLSLSRLAGRMLYRHIA